MTEKPYTNADVETVGAAIRESGMKNAFFDDSAGSWEVEEKQWQYDDAAQAVLDALGAAGRLGPTDDDPRPDQDRCTDTNPHPAHRTQYGGFGLKDCPGVPMTSREELREERVTTGRLEGDLRSQTRAVREALAERDEALDDRDQARRERDQNAADLQATADNNDRLRAILAATAEALHLNTGVDPNHIPATAAAARDAARNLEDGWRCLVGALRRAQEPQRGEFCHVHFSWLCQAGQGRCQNDAEARP